MIIEIEIITMPIKRTIYLPNLSLRMPQKEANNPFVIISANRIVPF
jgi:hypothetical protein